MAVSIDRSIDFAGDVVEDLIDSYGAHKVSEALSRLELALEDEGWNRLGAQSQYDFSRTGLKKIIELSRSMFLVNPLIRNAVMIQAHYVWAQGLNITPKAAVIQEVVQAFIDNRANKRELMGHQARILKEIALKTDGNVFFALFTNVSTGGVRIRTVPVDQVEQIVKNPEDDHEPWYYLRQWTERSNEDLTAPGAMKKAYYPDWMYRPQAKPAKLGDIDVIWEAPIYHVRVGGTDHMSYGVPEVYPALDWARAVVQLHEDYATIRRAQARFAWRYTTKGGPKAVTAAIKKMASTLSSDSNETNPPPVTGSTFVAAEGNVMEPIKTAGGQPSPDEGRRVGLMVTAAVGIPETMLFEDSTVGNYATAKSLDRPTELKMRDRQTLWAEVIGDILGYVVDQAGLRPNGPLKAKKRTDKFTGEVIVDILDPATRKPVNRTIDIDFPDILERDAKDRVEAIITAYTGNGFAPSNLIDNKTAARLVLTALGQDDVDETIKALFPENPNPPLNPDDPKPPAADTNEPSSTTAPPVPNDTTVPNPTGPLDSPTAATTEALRQELEENREMNRGVLATLAEALKGFIGLGEKQAEGVHKLAEAVAQRPVEVDVDVTLPEQPPQEPPVVNVTVPSPGPRRVTREAKFIQRDGRVVGKTETETEEVIE